MNAYDTKRGAKGAGSDVRNNKSRVAQTPTPASKFQRLVDKYSGASLVYTIFKHLAIFRGLSPLAPMAATSTVFMDSPGLTTEEDFALQGAKCTIPTSVHKGKKQLSQKDVELPRQIADVRICVEHVTELYIGTQFYNSVFPSIH